MKNIIFLTISVSFCCLTCQAQDVFKTTAATIEQLLRKPTAQNTFPSTDQHDVDTLRPARTLEELLARKYNNLPRDTNTVNTQNAITNQNKLFLPNKEEN